MPLVSIGFSYSTLSAQLGALNRMSIVFDSNLKLPYSSKPIATSKIYSLIHPHILCLIWIPCEPMQINVVTHIHTGLVIQTYIKARAQKLHQLTIQRYINAYIHKHKYIYRVNFKHMRPYKNRVNKLLQYESVKAIVFVNACVWLSYECINLKYVCVCISMYVFAYVLCVFYVCLCICKGVYVCARASNMSAFLLHLQVRKKV